MAGCSHNLAINGRGHASNWGIIGVVSSFREFAKTKARTNGRGMDLFAGGGAFVRADGWCCASGVWRRLLRGGLLQHPRASSSQVSASADARYGSHGLRT